METFEKHLGAHSFFLALVFWDVFETIVVPRPTPGWFRLGRYLVRGAWRAVRATGGAEVGATRDRLLGLFAPAAIVLLLVSWLTGLILGYGLVFFALRDELQPAPHDLGTALYFAATSILTLGFGDIVAIGAPARIVVVAAAASGLGVVALVVTFLFSLFGFYQRREISVVMLEAKAGVPPSAVVLLEALARMELVARLPEFFGDWERWAAEVLDSHVAYPLLGFFRSSHDNLSWISALGTVLDAASLVLTTISMFRPTSQAHQARWYPSRRGHHQPRLSVRGLHRHHKSRRLTQCMPTPTAPHFTTSCPTRSEAWEALSASRATYAPGLEAMANYWAVPSTSWFGGN